ncbi:MAG TPA: hypothetical protein VLY87_02385 [Flavobacterium sp.]|nr:hypothetical protein [Flavobacterium sp.]
MLLQEYGKVFYYEVFIDDAWSNNLFHGILAPEINNIGNGYWQPIMNAANNANLSTVIPPATITPSVAANLYYYQDFSLSPPGTVWDTTSGTYECDSREVVLDIPVKLDYFSFPTPTGQWEVSLKIIQGNTDWFGSTLWLAVKPM